MDFTPIVAVQSHHCKTSASLASGRQTIGQYKTGADHQTKTKIKSQIEASCENVSHSMNLFFHTRILTLIVSLFACGF